MKSRPNICSITLALAVAVAGWTLHVGAGDDNSAVNPTGTWKVTYISTNRASTFESTLKLKLEGDRLTGTLSRSHNQEIVEMVLKDAKLKASEISFTVTIPPQSGNGPNYTGKYRGTISGDTIKGKVEDEWMGQRFPTRDWEAKRVKE